MSMASVKTKKITLRTADKQEFEVDEVIAMEFGTVKAFLDDNTDASEELIPLPNVSSECLSIIIEYCKSHLAFRNSSPEEEAKAKAKAYDEELLKTLNNEILKDIISVANYLNIKDLLNMLIQAVADRIANKSVEYVRKYFGIENDFTPEEEAQLRAQNEWAFEGVDRDDN
ncbi:hypothetical protein REPUB_Repub13aG0221000 [Reevesia pubescens]